MSDIDPWPDVGDDGHPEIAPSAITPYPNQHSDLNRSGSGRLEGEAILPSNDNPVFGSGTSGAAERYLHVPSQNTDTFPNLINDHHGVRTPPSITGEYAPHIYFGARTGTSYSIDTEERKEAKAYHTLKAETALGFLGRPAVNEPVGGDVRVTNRHHPGPSSTVPTTEPPTYIEVSEEYSNNMIRSYDTNVPNPSQSSVNVQHIDDQLRKIFTILASLLNLEPEYRRDEVLQAFYILQLTLGEIGVRLGATEDHCSRLEGDLEILSRSHERLINAFEEGSKFLMDVLRKRDGKSDMKREHHEMYAVKQFERCFRLLGLDNWQRPSRDRP